MRTVQSVIAHRHRIATVT